ncbi:MAG: resolvase [Arthrobacter sp.]|jgi:putative DNA-invertase from lambdoid prophage Rac|nr:resolvase [Arthrobacter sp.]
MLQLSLDLTSPVGKTTLPILAAAAEMERDQLFELTQAGLARTKKEGNTLDRPTKTSKVQRKEISAKHQTGTIISEMARQYGESRLGIAHIAKPALHRSLIQ